MMTLNHSQECNFCGGAYEMQGGRWRCPCCGAYAPENISNEESYLIQTAFQKLRLAEFEQAALEFDDIIQKYPENHHGYWGRLMSKYGVKYERDSDGSVIPTCYANSFASIAESPDYQKAMACADEDFRAYYLEQIAYTERVRKEWVEKASKEAPYDIFISYKESDRENNVDRTADSIAAQALYARLTERGYRVFYSRETLREKAGEKYEPYIFQALHTAKVMIVYGSKAEYIESTWVKNEWMRYKNMIYHEQKQSNSLLVACDGFSPAELPLSLSSVQALNAQDRGFYSDLDAVVDRIIKGETGGSFPGATAKKSKLPLIATLCLIGALLAGFLVLSMIGGAKTPVMNVSGSSYGAVVEAKGEGFPEGTEFIVAQVLGNGTLDGKAQALPVNKENYYLYDMKLLCDGTEIQPGQSIAVTLDLPSGIDADRAVIYYMSGNTPELLPSTVSDGKITFTTNHFSVYMIAQEEDPACEHTIVTQSAVQPTCTKNGRTEKQYCSLCGEVLLDSETIPATGHTHTAVVTNPTCVQQGYTEYTCACGDAYVGDIVPALGHTPGAAATCTKAQRCTVCRMELVPAKEHDYGETVIENSCTEYGYTEYICRNEGCEDAYRENYVEPAGHAPDAPATCTKESKCSVCGVTLASALGHRVETWEIDRDFSADVLGEKHGTCTVCKETVREAITSSEGLSYTQNPDGTLSVSGRGNCKDPFIVIPAVFDGKAVTGIADGAFSGYTDLIYVFIPNTVKTIGEQAFAGCTSLSTLVVSDGVEKIGYAAFYHCTVLVTLTVPASVQEIGYAAFSGCSALTEITLPFVGSVANAESFDETSLFGYIFGASRYDGGTPTQQYFMKNGNPYQTFYYIPSRLRSVTVTGGNVPFGAFSGCLSLSAVTMNGVRLIGAYSFYGCPGLKTVSIDAIDAPIGDYAFFGCVMLESVTMTGVTAIGESAFCGCLILDGVTVPASVKTIGEKAFFGCTSLSDITISVGVETIASYAFGGCVALETVVVPDSVKTIGKAAFYGCADLESMTIPFVGGSADGGKKDGSSVFGYIFGDDPYIGGNFTIQKHSGGYDYYYIPNGLKSVTVTGGGELSYGAFSGCNDIKSITLGEGVTAIGQYAFEDCKKLTEIRFEGTLHQWNTLAKKAKWNDGVPAKKVVCSDGEAEIK